MRNVRVTGKTFQHKERLKQLGGLWDAADSCWRFNWIKPRELAELKNLVGCTVVDEKPEPYTPPAPIEKPSSDPLQGAYDTIERVLEKRNNEEFDGRHRTNIYGDDQTYFNYFKDKNPIAFFGFSNLSEMIKYIEAIPDAKKSGARDQGFSNDMGTKWRGSASMSEAIQIARDGWKDGSDKAASVLEFLNLDSATQRRRAYSVAGGNVSVGRLLAGNPAHMICRPSLPGRRNVTLFVENCASAYMNADMLAIRASIIAAFADILEDRGYSCQIVATTMQATYNGKPCAQTAVTIKHAGEKLNLDDIVFSLGHPSFLRRFNFACVSSCDQLESIWESQGTPANAFKPDAMARNEFYIPKLTRNFSGDNFIEIAKQMLPLLKPANLPLTLEFENDADSDD